MNIRSEDITIRSNYLSYIKNPKYFLVIIFFLSVLIRTVCIDFNIILRDDAFTYLLKGLEISKGNFIPVHSHSIGLSLLISPLLYIFRSQNIIDLMPYAIFLNVIISSIVVYPIYLLSKLIYNKKVAFISCLLSAFSSVLILHSRNFLSENLFIIFFLFSIFFFLKHKENNFNLLISFSLASISYYIKPYGIFLIPILSTGLIVFFEGRLSFKISRIILGVLLFFIISSPHMYQRYENFGSPTTYGANDKYFNKSYKDVWSNNVPRTEFLELLDEASIWHLIKRFTVYGFFRVSAWIFNPFSPFSSGLLDPFMFCFFIISIYKTYKKKITLFPLYLIFFYMIGLSIISYAFNYSRHAIPFYPLFLIYSAYGISSLFEEYRNKYINYMLILISFILINSMKIYRYDYQPTKEMPKWASWAARNLKGTICILEGYDLIMMNTDNVSVSGVNQSDLYDNSINLRTTRPGTFENIDDALLYFNKTNIKYIITDSKSIYKRPYLKEIKSKKRKEFKNIYNETESSKDINIYRIFYD